MLSIVLFYLGFLEGLESVLSSRGISLALFSEFFNVYEQFLFIDSDSFGFLFLQILVHLNQTRFLTSKFVELSVLLGDLILKLFNNMTTILEL